jgi:phenylalanyl-tRNA synthetase beta chain
MRLSMVFGGLESIAFNKNRKASDIRFYEWGKVYSIEEKVTDDPLQKYNEKEQLVFFVSGLAGNESWNAKPPKADFYYLKSLIHQVFERTGVDFKQFEVKEQAEGGECSKGLAYYFNSRHLCSFGAVKTELCRQFDIKDDVFFGYIDIETFMQLIALNKVQYKPVARYPEVRRDLALLLNNTVNFSDIEKIAFETGKDLLKKVTLFDIFEDQSLGDGKKSYALSFILQDEEATLTDERIDALMKRLVDDFASKLGAGLR